MIRWFASGVKRIFRSVFSLPKRFCIWVFNLPRRFWRWGRRLPKKISIPGSLLLVALIAFGIYHLVGFWNYMQDDPDFCNSCHIMSESWDRWETSEHVSIDCHKCHHQSLIASATQLFNFIFSRPDEITKHAEVEEEICMTCHESGNANWIQVANTTGHKLHNEIEDIECVICHSTSLHSFAPTGDTCVNCHEDQRVTMAGMDDMHCHICHDFIVDSELFHPERAACLDCHEALATDITWTADAPMQYPCGDCHMPHEQTHVTVDCIACHTTFGGYHLIGSHKVMDCETCHKAHVWDVEERETCLTCHPAQAEHHAPTPCNTCHTYTAH